jgi:hypothetical protein
LRLAHDATSGDADGARIEALVVSPAVEEIKASVHVTFLLNFFDELRRRATAGK